jgi:hypothetical protein
MVPNAAVAGAVMFQRDTGISCDACKSLCVTSNLANGTWKCVSATYDNRFRICDQFALNANSGGSTLVNFPGRDYYR